MLTGTSKTCCTGRSEFINYLTLTLIKTVACPDILKNASIHEENEN